MSVLREDQWQLGRLEERCFQLCLERDSLITALRECVVVLEKCRARMSLWDGSEVGIDEVFHNTKSTLERYGDK